MKDRLDGVLYVPYRISAKSAVKKSAPYQPFFKAVGIDVPVHFLSKPVQVDEVYVPELGFGWGEKYAGSPMYREIMRRKLSESVDGGGSEKLYISRAGLPSQRGGVLGETIIERNLERQGYEVFRPEKHSFPEQLARYKSAKKIVALDGSALHLAAYMMQPGGQVGVILRRSRANIRDYALQFRSFCGIEIDPIDVLAKDWISGDLNRVDYSSVGELDFARLFEQLGSLGYTDPNFRPEVPTQAEIALLLEEFAGRRNAVFEAYSKSSSEA